MIYLASSSPRRKQLLLQIGVDFEALPLDIDESILVGEMPLDYVLRMAINKAEQGFERLTQSNTEVTVLAADTIITIDDKIIGKPVDRQHCQSILSSLSGREHQVMSAVALAQRCQTNSRISINRVRFTNLSDEDIQQYCSSDEPMDKAGAYAIQGRAAIFIEHLEGSYSSVMGLPLFETAELLKEAGISV